MGRRGARLTCFAAAWLPAAAQAQVTDRPPRAVVEAWHPPTLTTTRWSEDWSRLEDPAARTGRWTERFKYVPLASDAYLTAGIELRARYESSQGNAWTSGTDDDYLWLRALPYADLHVERARVFVQPVAAYALGTGSDPSPVEQTRTDMLQAFVDWRLGSTEATGTGLTLRAGRQLVSLGSERLIGTRYGPNVQLAFDGFRGTASTGRASMSVFALRPVAPGTDSFDDRRSRTRSLWGGYATLPGLDLYYIGNHNRRATFGDRTGRELRHSLGVRAFGEGAELHWNVEGVAQVGRFAGGTIRAWTIATEIGRHFPDAPLAPDATVRINVASGDGRRGDRTLGTFNALYPRGKYFGELSPVGPYNIISVNPRVVGSLGGGVSASLAGMAYWRFSREDGVYDVPGNLVRAPGAVRERFIGKEVEAVLEWQATPELGLSASLSAFEPGGFIRRTGSAPTITLLGLETSFRF